MVRTNPVVAGERQLESSAETGSVDRRHDWHPRLRDEVQQPLAKTAGVFRVLLDLEPEELLDVRAGDEDLGFAAREHDRIHRAVALHLQQDALELGPQRSINLVDRIAGLVEGDEENTGAILRRERGFRFLALRFRCQGLDHVARSTTIACPIPPAAHTVMRPNWASRRASS